MYKKLLLFLTFLSVFSIAIAQNQGTISNNILVIFGKKFYIHAVQKNETIYSISRLYNVDQEEILKYNAEVPQPITVGQTLRIPILEGQNPTEEISDAEKFIYHTVKRKQTLYSLCKKYEVTEEDIIAYNPAVKQGLKNGMVLKIPNFASGAFTSEDDNFYYHRIGQKETLFSIAQRFDVSIELLTQNNPQIKEGLKAGETLKIPKKINKVVDTNVNNNNSNSKDPLYFTDPSCLPCDKYKYDDKPFKIALMLPFFAENNFGRTLENEKDFFKNTEKFYQYYEGCLLAVNGLKDDGVKIDLYLYDTRNDLQTVNDILKKPELKNMDLIVGPVYSEQIKAVAEYAKSQRINFVSPIAQKDDILTNNPFVFQVHPSNNYIIEQTTDYLKNLQQTNIILVTSGVADEDELMKAYKKQLLRTINNVVVKEINYTLSKIDGLEDALSVGLENVIIVPSSDEVFVSEIVNKIYKFNTDYKITLLGMPAWERFESFDYEFLNILKYRYPSPVYIDYSNWKVRSMVNKYREVYKTEPSSFSFQGYDVINYFVPVLKQYGKYFQFCFQDAELQPYNNGTVLRFDFKRTGRMNGFENQAINILEFQSDFTFKKKVLK